MAQSGNDIPREVEKMAVKPVLMGTGMPNPKHKGYGSGARDRQGSRTRFRRCFEVKRSDTCCVFRAIESRTSTRPVFQRCDRRKFLTIRASKKVAEFGDDFTAARKRNKADFLWQVPAAHPGGCGCRKCRLAATKGSPGFARAEASAAENAGATVWREDYAAASRRPSTPAGPARLPTQAR